MSIQIPSMEGLMKQNFQKEMNQLRQELVRLAKKHKTTEGEQPQRNSKYQTHGKKEKKKKT